MTIDDLIADARGNYLADDVEPYLWSDDALLIFANEAIVEACRRAPLIYRVKTVSIVAGTAEYTLNKAIRQILVAKMALQLDPLLQKTDYDLSVSASPDWRSRNATPINYIREKHTLTLYPNPVVNDTLSLTCTCLPESDFDLEEDIDAEYHESLVYWIVYRAFMKKDVDAYDPVKAEAFLEKFTAAFGVKKSAKYEQVANNLPMYATVIGGKMC